jgi:hypothetical protein
MFGMVTAMADWAVTFLVRGEEGNRLDDGRARTVIGRDAVDRVTNDGTDVTLRGSGFRIGEALDQARQQLANATGLQAPSLELMGAVRVGGRYLVRSRTITIVFTGNNRRFAVQLHCIDPETSAAGFFMGDPPSHLVAYPQGSGAEREYEYEPGGINVTPIPRTVRCLEGDQRPSPFATVADAMTDSRLVHQVFSGSHFTLCAVQPTRCGPHMTPRSLTARSARNSRRSSECKPKPLARPRA